MRNIINISLPQELSQIVDRTVSKGEYASKSEFFRHILRLWLTGQEIEESRHELVKGKGKLLRSLKDLR